MRGLALWAAAHDSSHSAPPPLPSRSAVFIGTAAVLPYQWLNERCALVAWSSGAAWLMHLGAFLGTDLAHYT